MEQPMDLVVMNDYHATCAIGIISSVRRPTDHEARHHFNKTLGAGPYPNLHGLWIQDGMHVQKGVKPPTSDSQKETPAR